MRDSVVDGSVASRTTVSAGRCISGRGLSANRSASPDSHRPATAQPALSRKHASAIAGENNVLSCEPLDSNLRGVARPNPHQRRGWDRPVAWVRCGCRSRDGPGTGRALRVARVDPLPRYPLLCRIPRCLPCLLMILDPLGWPCRCSLPISSLGPVSPADVQIGRHSDGILYCVQNQAVFAPSTQLISGLMSAFMTALSISPPTDIVGAGTSILFVVSKLFRATLTPRWFRSGVPAPATAEVPISHAARTLRCPQPMPRLSGSCRSRPRLRSPLPPLPSPHR